MENLPPRGVTVFCQSQHKSTCVKAALLASAEGESLFYFYSKNAFLEAPYSVWFGAIG